VSISRHQKCQCVSVGSHVLCTVLFNLWPRSLAYAVLLKLGPIRGKRMRLRRMLGEVIASSIRFFIEIKTYSNDTVASSTRSEGSLQCYCNQQPFSCAGLHRRGGDPNVDQLVINKDGYLRLASKNVARRGDSYDYGRYKLTAVYSLAAKGFIAAILLWYSCWPGEQMEKILVRQRTSENTHRCWRR
jgi:hypothetical protein